MAHLYTAPSLAVMMYDLQDCCDYTVGTTFFLSHGIL